MNISPNLSASQILLFNQLTCPKASAPQAAKCSRGRAPAAERHIDKVASQQPTVAISGRVEVRRDIPDTLYRAGQRGVVLALHGNPPKVAEVEVDGSYYSDVVSLRDLKVLE